MFTREKIFEPASSIVEAQSTEVFLVLRVHLLTRQNGPVDTENSIQRYVKLQTQTKLPRKRTRIWPIPNLVHAYRASFFSSDLPRGPCQIQYIYFFSRGGHTMIALILWQTCVHAKE